MQPLLGLLATLFVSLSGSSSLSDGCVHPTDSDFAFRSSPISGGGGVTAIRWDPAGGGRAMLGGDVAGLFRTVDYGHSWSPCSEGLADWTDTSIAAITYDSSNPGFVYSGAGRKGMDGGLYFSDDTGDRWELLSDQIQFSGVRNGGDPQMAAALTAPGCDVYETAYATNDLPRSTGRLIEIDEDDRILFAGSYQDGLFAAELNAAGGINAGPVAIALDGAPTFSRSLALAPEGGPWDHPSPSFNYLFVGTLTQGLIRYRVTTTWPVTATFAGRLTPPDCVVESIGIAGDQLVYAAGPSGVYSVTAPASGGGISTLISPGDRTAFWRTVEVRATSSETVVWSGCVSPRDDGGDTAKDAVVVSRKSAGVWTNFFPITETNVLQTLLDGTPWWRSDAESGEDGCFGPGDGDVNNLMGRGSFRAATIAAGPTTSGRILVGGSSGAYLRPSWIQPGASAWQPAVVGQQGTVATQVGSAFNGDTYFGVKDWQNLRSADGAQTLELWDQAPPSMKGWMATAYAFDPDNPDIAYIAASATGGVPGAHIVRYDPSAGCAAGTWEVIDDIDWVGEPWRPLQMISGTDVDGAFTLIMAAVPYTSSVTSVVGVWSWNAVDGWSRISDMTTSLAMLDTPIERDVSLAWGGGDEPVYLYSPVTGLWNNYEASGPCAGAASLTWTSLWTGASPFFGTGYMILDSAAPGVGVDRLWLSVSGELRTIEVCGGVSLTSNVVVPILSASLESLRTSVLAQLCDNSLLVATLPTPLASGDLEPARIFNIGDLGTLQYDVSDGFFRDAVVVPTDMEVISNVGLPGGPTAASERIAIGLLGSGYVVGERTYAVPSPMASDE